MMMKFLFVTIISISLLTPTLGQTKLLISSDGDTIQLDLFEDAFDLTGKRLYYDQNMILRSEVLFHKGLINGSAKYYYENGQLGEIGSCVEGLKQGEWNSFYENGVQQSSGNYDTVKVGEWTYWWNNGKLKAKGEYVLGLKAGSWKYYNSDGNLESEGS
ncbi:MAG: hypothetical protein AAFU33_28045, partial [Bacteroidota bacterium]